MLIAAVEIAGFLIQRMVNQPIQFAVIWNKAHISLTVQNHPFDIAHGCCFKLQKYIRCLPTKLAQHLRKTTAVIQADGVTGYQLQFT